MRAGAPLPSVVGAKVVDFTNTFAKILNGDFSHCI